MSLSGLTDDLLHAGLLNILQRMKESPKPRLSRLRWAATGASTFAGILLLIGLWRVAELALGPILAPLLGAALFAAMALGLTAYCKVRQPEPTGLATSLVSPRTLLTLLELWLAPKAMRKSMLLGFGINSVNRLFGSRH